MFPPSSLSAVFQVLQRPGRFAMILVLVCLDGCGRQHSGNLSQTGLVQSAFVEVTDGLNRKLSLPAPPQRIVSLAPSNTEILFALGAGNRLVGVTTYCEYPAEAAEIEKVGGFTTDVSLEKIVALRPDLVMAYSSQQTSLVADMERLGVAVFVADPTDFQSVFDTIQEIGKAIDAQDMAEQLLANMHERISDVESRLDGISDGERVTVFYQLWEQPLMTATDQTYVGEMIRRARGVNILGDISGMYPQVSAEVVLQADPDVILAPKVENENSSQLQPRPGWESLSAVRHDRLHRVDADLVSRPGPRLAFGLEEVARAFYPERFRD